MTAFAHPHERHCFENAAYFTAVRGRRPRQRTRTEHATFDEARAQGTGDGRTMIYAITAEGRDAHICNI